MYFTAGEKVQCHVWSLRNICNLRLTVAIFYFDMWKNASHECHSWIEILRLKKCTIVLNGKSGPDDQYLSGKLFKLWLDAHAKKNFPLLAVPWCTQFSCIRSSLALRLAAFWVLVCLYQSFFNFAFSSRLCDAGSSLQLWCLASTLNRHESDGYLVALQCCTSSAYISLFFPLLFCCSCVGRISSAIKLRPQAFVLACFYLHFVSELDLCENRGIRASETRSITFSVWYWSANSLTRPT